MIKILKIKKSEYLTFQSAFLIFWVNSFTSMYKAT